MTLLTYIYLMKTTQTKWTLKQQQEHRDACTSKHPFKTVIMWFSKTVVKLDQATDFYELIMILKAYINTEASAKSTNTYEFLWYYLDWENENLSNYKYW